MCLLCTRQRHRVIGDKKLAKRNSFSDSLCDQVVRKSKLVVACQQHTAKFITGAPARKPDSLRSMVEKLQSGSRRARGNTAALSACSGRGKISESPAFRHLKVNVRR